MLKKSWTNHDNVLKIIRLLLWLAPIALLIWLLGNYFVPGGRLELAYQVDEESSIFKNFASKERDKLLGTENVPGATDVYQIITTSPFYFNVVVPRPFFEADIYLKYKNPDQQPSIRLGVEKPDGNYYFTDMAFLNPNLDNLPPYWQMIRKGDLVLWQLDREYKNELQERDDAYQQSKEVIDYEYKETVKRIERFFQDIGGGGVQSEDRQIRLREVEQEYDEQLKKITLNKKVIREPQTRFDSIDDFLTNVPATGSMLRYNYNLSTNLELPNYRKSNVTTVITKSLRGPHEIYTYIGKGEDLNFIFTIQDINRHAGKDIFSVKVYNAWGEKIEEVKVPDDGEDQATGRVFPERRHQLLLENIPHGIYRIVIDIVDDDIFIKKIETFQNLFMFNKNIYLADNAEYTSVLGDKELRPTTLYTTGSFFRARTAHDDGCQSLRVGSQSLVINETHTLETISDLKGITSIVSPRNDVYLESDGLFAFSQDQIFDTTFGLVKSVNEVSDIDDYDYIIANYPKAQQENEWLVAKAHVTSPDLYFHKGNDLTANFIITFPGLPENNRTIRVKEVRVVFQKEPITISNIFERLKNKFK